MPYQWILFDADNTLFDFDRSARHSLEQAMLYFDLPFEETHHITYGIVNKRCWEAFERGELSPKVLRSKRFELFFNEIGVSANPSLFSKCYLEFLAGGDFMLDGARALLEQLHSEFQLVLITNGLKEVQRPRIQKAELQSYFHTIVVSDEIGSAKPHPAFFDYTFEQIGQPKKEEAIVVGDSLSSDILGGQQYGLDTVWYNPKKKQSPEHIRPTYQIEALADLHQIIR